MATYANHFSEKSLANMIALYRRSVITSKEVANQLIELTDLDDTEGYVQRLSSDLAHVIQVRLIELPNSDAQWADYWVPKLDGSEDAQEREISFPIHR
jgi:hypothetical protein